MALAVFNQGGMVSALFELLCLLLRKGRGITTTVEFASKGKLQKEEWKNGRKNGRERKGVDGNLKGISGREKNRCRWNFCKLALLL